MMKFLFKTIISILLFFYFLLLFFPKEGFYNLVEKELSKNKIFVSNEIRKEKLFGLKVDDMYIYFDGLDSANISSMDFTTFLFLTTLEIKDVRVSKSFEDILPSKVETLTLKHTVISFDTIDIKANGDFGEFSGQIRLLDKKIIGFLEPSSLMQSKYRKILQKFKLKDGKYEYELNF